jgi:hypothetical protein
MRPVSFPGTMRQRDVFTDEPPQHFVHVSHHFIEVEHDGLHGLFAAEDEQLPRQPGGAVGRVQNFIGVFSERTIRFKVRPGSDCCNP